MDISPLFAVDAEELLDQGKVQDAIDLCLKGLEVYPGYPAGEAILARAYKISGDSDKANEILESAIEKNPLNKALGTLKKLDLEIENVEKIHREPRFKPAIKRKKKKKTSKVKETEKINLKDVKLENEEFSVNDFYDDLELNDFGDEITNGSSENLINESIQDINESDNSDLLNDIIDEDLLNNELLDDELIESNEEIYEENLEEDIVDYNLSDFIEDEQTEDELNYSNDYSNIESLNDFENEDESLLDYSDITENIVENNSVNEFNDTNEDSNKGITIDFEDVELIPGLSSQDFRLNLKDVKSIDLVNIIFDYNIQKFDNNYKIKLLKSFENISLSELAIKLNDAKIGKIKSDLPEPEIVDYNVEEIATETMAEIYNEQGAFDEAIKVYNKLIIKYPKKSDYFKQKISEVIEAKENDLNNIKIFNLGN